MGRECAGLKSPLVNKAAYKWCEKGFLIIG